MRPIAGPAPLPRGETAVLAGFPLAKLLLHLFTYRGYGIFRDELYYLACADRLAWGYVDHPPLSIALLRGVTELFGDSLLALRWVPAVAGAVTVLLIGLMARRLGGGAFAQALAMASALAAPLYLALDHFYSMNALDLMFWALAAWWLIPILQDTGEDRHVSRRRWIVLGVILGLGLLNKISVLWLGFGLLMGLLLTRQRRLLLSPGPWIAGAVSALVFLPHLLWQIGHGWPTLEFMDNARSFKMAAISPWDFLADQTLAMNPFTAPVWVAGLLLLFLKSRRSVRPLAWMWIAVFALLAFSGSSRVSYMAPAYAWLFAAGGVRWETMVKLIPWWRVQPAFQVTFLLVVVGSGLVLAPLGIPVLPVSQYVEYAEALGQAPVTEENKELAELPQFFADMHGWPEIADAFERAADQLVPDERARAAVFTQNYGVAGALEYFGEDLPPVASGHNNYWLWGPPDGYTGDVMIVHGDSRENLERLFESVELAGRTDCGYCMPYENSRPIWIARGLKFPLDQAWDQVKHFD